eukprot:GHUV01024527.1.p2 GENE.GHUV01024527.1~~GHUV01024527.1.p2  ORF type:complete len:131 (+),score=5.86 GHUV01024527.1:111-503(+)
MLPQYQGKVHWRTADSHSPNCSTYPVYLRRNCLLGVFPANRILPSVLPTVLRPASKSSRVVLPLPLGPICRNSGDRYTAREWFSNGATCVSELLQVPYCPPSLHTSTDSPIHSHGPHLPMLSSDVAGSSR